MSDPVAKTSVVVIESVESEGTAWLVSLDGHNPEPDRCVEMASKEDAFRLRDILNAQEEDT